MSKLAGSAITQGPLVGRIDRWSEWKPTDRKPLWLLLSGATDPPKEIGISERRTRDAQRDRNGAFLGGVTRDLMNMEDLVEENLFNTVKDLYLSKNAALQHIRKLFGKCKRINAKPMIYYTGHGEIGTGNWCFENGTVSIQEIFDMVPEGCYYPMIFSDTCYSGHWANFCLIKGIPGFHCLAACPEYSRAYDAKGKGGDLTLYMTGKKLRPRTEPMYSGGNLHDFKITSGYDTVDYNEFIGSYVFNSGCILVSQNICDGFLSGIFVNSKLYSPRPSLGWGIVKGNYDEDILLFINKHRKESKNVYSLACDKEFGFGAFFMAGYGTEQVLVKGVKDVQKNWDDGFMITACATQGSTFYFIMTKDTKEYHGKGQRCFIRDSWKGANDEIQEGYRTGFALTGICYSSELERYLIVMTELIGEQCFRWFGTTKLKDMDDWEMEKHNQGFHPSIIFRDPTDNKTLIVMIKDENRSLSFVRRVNYKLR